MRPKRQARGPVIRRGHAASARLERLTLSEFRSFASADLRFGSGPVILLGPNGSGKTNILEAISLLAPGRGLRGAKIGDMTRAAATTARGGLGRLGRDFSGVTGPVRLGTGLAP